MPETNPKMMCPECGTAMNHHAEKLVDPRDALEAVRVDAALGGLLEEHHACPQCGKGEARPSTLSSDA